MLSEVAVSIPVELQEYFPHLTSTIHSVKREDGYQMMKKQKYTIIASKVTLITENKCALNNYMDEDNDAD